MAATATADIISGLESVGGSLASLAGDVSGNKGEWVSWGDTIKNEIADVLANIITLIKILDQAPPEPKTLGERFDRWINPLSGFGETYAQIYGIERARLLRGTGPTADDLDNPAFLRAMGLDDTRRNERGEREPITAPEKGGRGRKAGDTSQKELEERIRKTNAGRRPARRSCKRSRTLTSTTRNGNPS
jgi:hypothetical protein